MHSAIFAEIRFFHVFSISSLLLFARLLFAFDLPECKRKYPMKWFPLCAMNKAQKIWMHFIGWIKYKKWSSQYFILDLEIIFFLWRWKKKNHTQLMSSTILTYNFGNGEVVEPLFIHKAIDFFIHNSVALFSKTVDWHCRRAIASVRVDGWFGFLGATRLHRHSVRCFGFSFIDCVQV